MNEFIYGAHLLSLGGAGIILSILLIVDIEVQLKVLILTYLIYQIVYTYNHFRELQQDLKSNPERAKHLMSKQIWVRISPFIYSLLLSIFLLFTNLNTILLCLFIVIGGILYTEYFKSVRILGFKSYYVSSFWAASVILIPLFYNLDSLLPYLYFALFIFVRLFVSTTFFDIKDIESDKALNIKTIPIYLGKSKTLYLLQILNILSLVPIIIGIYNNSLPSLAVALVPTIMFDVLYLTAGLLFEGKALRTLSYVVVDGQYIFWPVIILIWEYLV